MPILCAILVTAQVHIKDKTPNNNYNYPGNKNPYTGKVATTNKEIYLNRYYNKSASSNISSTQYYSSDNSGFKSGIFFKLFRKSERYIVYNIYKANRYVGFLTIYPDNTGRLFDEDNNYVKTIKYLNSDIIKSLNSDYFIANPSLAAAHSSNVHLPKYLKDIKGDYTGEYLTLKYEDAVSKKYNLYNSAGTQIGYLSTYSTGERILFDVSGKVIKRTAAPK